jgi:hypothetical protein
MTTPTFEQDTTHLREILRQTKQQLEDAETALRFYANPKSYKISRCGDISKVCYQNNLVEDFEAVDAKTSVAGYRARAYFNRYDKD